MKSKTIVTTLVMALMVLVIAVIYIKVLFPYLLFGAVVAGLVVWGLSKSNKRLDRKIVRTVRRGVEASQKSAKEVANTARKKYEELRR